MVSKAKDKTFICSIIIAGNQYSFSVIVVLTTGTLLVLFLTGAMGVVCDNVTSPLK